MQRMSWTERSEGRWKRWHRQLPIYGHVFSVFVNVVRFEFELCVVSSVCPLTYAPRGHFTATLFGGKPLSTHKVAGRRQRASDAGAGTHTHRAHRKTAWWVELSWVGRARSSSSCCCCCCCCRISQNCITSRAGRWLCTAACAAAWRLMFLQPCSEWLLSLQPAAARLHSWCRCW